MPSTEMVQSLRAALEQERDQLRGQLRELGVGGEGPAYDENFADSGQVAAEQGEHRALVSKLSEALTDAEAALAKMEAGTYGTCERCGNEIAEPRLEAMPHTRYCISCASRG